jgi:Rrf2 family protein
MRMSEGVEWAVHCLVVLAGLPPDAALPAKALAEFHGVSESYLVKHLQALAGAGVLDSISGPKGGYRLARPPDAITLLDVVEAIEGGEPAFRCAEIRMRGPAAVEPAAYPLPCRIHVAMLRADAAWKQSLRSQTIAGLTDGLRESLDPRIVERSDAWLEHNTRR